MRLQIFLAAVALSGCAGAPVAPVRTGYDEIARSEAENIQRHVALVTSRREKVVAILRDPAPSTCIISRAISLARSTTEIPTDIYIASKSACATLVNTMLQSCRSVGPPFEGAWCERTYDTATRPSAIEAVVNTRARRAGPPAANPPRDIPI